MAETPMSTTSSNNKLDFGLSVGIGKSIAIGGSNTLTIELRDDLGLAKVGKFTNSSSNALNLLWVGRSRFNVFLQFNPNTLKYENHRFRRKPIHQIHQ
jgi:hypothetical protein